MLAPLPRPWKFCASWLSGRSATRQDTHKHLSLAFSWKSKCTKVKTPVCTHLSWQTTPKHPRFLWRILERRMHPTFSINRKPSFVGWRKTTTMLEHTALDRLGDYKLLPADLVVLQKFLCLAWANMQILQESQTLGDPKVPLTQALMWKGPHFNHIRRPVLVFSVTLAHL